MAGGADVVAQVEGAELAALLQRPLRLPMYPPIPMLWIRIIQHSVSAAVVLAGAVISHL